jgi:hypothetical protein
VIDFFELESPENQRFLRLFRNADFDPLSGLALAGGAISAAGTLMGGAGAAKMGAMQQQAADFQAQQDIMNSAAEIAAAQRKSIDTQYKTNLLRSRAVAGAAAGGVETTTGSPLTNEAQIEARGRYAASLDLWNGQNAATGDLNKAAAAYYYSGEMAALGGEMAQDASFFSAAGTLMSSGASAYKMYGMKGMPSPGAQVGFG